MCRTQTNYHVAPHSYTLLFVFVFELFSFGQIFSNNIEWEKVKVWPVCWLAVWYVSVVCNPIADAAMQVAMAVSLAPWPPLHSTFHFHFFFIFDIAIGLSRAFASLRPLYTHTANGGSVFYYRFRGLSLVKDAHGADLRLAATLDYTLATF